METENSTLTQALSGMLSAEDIKSNQSLIDNGIIPDPKDGLYKRWVPCKVLNSYETGGNWFFSKKYYFTIEINGVIKDIRVGVNNYYKDKNMTSIRMYSEDNKIWYLIRTD